MSTNTSPSPDATLKAVTLLCHVPPAAAIRSGKGRMGTAALPLHPECLTALGESGRAALATFATVVGDGALALPDPQCPDLSQTSPVVVEDGDTTSPGLARAIRARLDAVVSVVEAAVVSVVALPDRGIRPLDVTIADRRLDYRREPGYAPSGYPGVPNHARIILRFAAESVRATLKARIVAATEETDARVAELLAGVVVSPDDAEGWYVDPTLAFLCPTAAAFERRVVQARIDRRAAVAAALEARQARDTEAREAAEAARVLRAARLRESVRAFALTIPDAAPGAEDGYDMAPAVADTLAARVAAILDGTPGVVETTVLREGSEAHTQTDPPDARRSPSAASVKARRTADADLNPIRTTLPPDLTLDVSPVGRVIDYAATDDGESWVRRTGFTVDLTAVDGLPFPRRRVIAWCEGAAQ